ncbi:hypothetical protein Z517_06677 [Fonsecaea pedrosoi CBS 271.37]|uniref:Uncharacterized protein n=1 Tax=Fonsecaea pedrosoi CBS 271.37 TaxID=1442368 RepID=A0A0D2F0E1_9EURO|nr:uncharacterized protein Z517_06677 [Fonsecaea pedrosoi CBS 271.37]KIW80062.1 hypothetical protein Z517_06677 [Fonsecaea pedrosoi CBS 271.37]
MASSDNEKPAKSPVCIITGGASGMGLAVAEHLWQLGWNVTIIDVNEESGKEIAAAHGDSALFFKANVADYEELSVTFAKTWDRWGRLDAVFGNAGIGDRISFYKPQPDRADGTPPKPSTAVIDIDLLGPIYCAYLGFHFFRKNPDKSGKLIFTSSMAGIYPGPTIPLYTASKHGVVGLTRALAQQLRELGEPVTVNCICPGLVHTGLTKIYSFTTPEEYITPVSTIITAFMRFIDDSSRTGQAAECSGENIHYRVQPEWSDDKAEFLGNGGLAKAMKQHNVKLY